MAESFRAGHANRLIAETSPYLLQHAHNPVDWHPWGPEALERARVDDKPILLSVGYSACHWCHVMAHESFEDPETAALMNESFVNIKVDREERPDIDAIYMEAVQAMAGNGGWPMTVFLTPQGKPFYGGTYFPPTPRYGMPAFSQVLAAVAEAWRERRHELEEAGERMADALNRSASVRSPDNVTLTPDVTEQAARKLALSHDSIEGGFGSAPKFPQPMNLDFLLQTYRRTGGPALLAVVTLTLDKMMHGGIYDHLGGGFHRYSTDDHWLVPHFEKMLYDNAQLARVYLHAWQLTANPEYCRVVEETLDYVLREMVSPEGGIRSTQDADSEGEEGKFFLWTPAQVTALLSPEDARLFMAYYGITERGNFREGGPGANILNVSRSADAVAVAEGITPEMLAVALRRGRAVLFTAREQRIHPGRDDKVLVEWNGLMIEALAEAGAALGREDYLSAARNAAAFILEHMHAPSNDDGARLYRTYKDGQAKLNAYLEDYAAIGLGLVALYQADFDLRWLQAALQMAGTILSQFHDSEGGAFFQTAHDHERLVTRRKDLVDSAVPSGNALTAELLLRLAALSGRRDYVPVATEVMFILAEAMRAQPAAFGRLLAALDLYVYPGREIAIVGEPTDARAQALLAEIRGRYLPDTVVALAPSEEAAERQAGVVPLLAGRGQVGARPTAFVCRNFVCNLPVTEPTQLAEQLEQ
jgi:uncharacterized protein YyaL (SSP411 family)